MQYILYLYLLNYIEIMEGDVENAYIIWRDHILDCIDKLEMSLK